MPRLQAIAALVRRDYLITRSYRAALVLQLAVGGVGLVIYYYISRNFGDVAARARGEAPTYFAFAAVGIAIAGVIQAASIGLARRVREEQLTGTLEALVAHPVSTVEMALGMAGFPFLFALVSSLVYLALASALGADFGNADWLGFFVTIGATGAAVVGIGVLVGALVFVVKRAEVAAGFATSALAFLGGAFFPIAVLPDWLKTIADAVPTRFAFQGVRAALYRGEGWGHPTVSLLIFAAVLMPLALLAFHQAVLWARRRGSLGQY